MKSHKCPQMMSLESKSVRVNDSIKSGRRIRDVPHRFSERRHIGSLALFGLRANLKIGKDLR